jgi:hypothetical protein
MNNTMSKREESRKEMYSLYEGLVTEKGIYDLAYDYYFTLEEAKKTVDIMIDEVLQLNEDEDFNEKFASLSMVEQYAVCIGITEKMHLYGIIDDSIYEEAIKRTEKTYNNYI